MKILSTQDFTPEEIVKKLRRAQPQDVGVEAAVREIIDLVRRRGDRALFALTRKFDGAKLDSLAVTRGEIQDAYRSIDRRLLKALRRAKRNIRKFHIHQVQRKERSIEVEKGVRIWREFRPIERVGLYIPGGKAAYCSTVLMLAVPASIAGCREVVMCTPASESGRCDSAVLVAADLCGIQGIYKVGGAQAIAAMAFGTETVRRVYKIVGPGNRYVTTAKLLVYGDVDIDMPAGPSEVLVIADESAEARWIAADLLAQLEHGEDSQGILLTPSRRFAERVVAEIKIQIKQLRRGEIIREALKKSFAVVVNSIDEACLITNVYAPEHLEIVTQDGKNILQNIANAGSVFLGPYASEPLGDYATGANHTLPTSGYSRMFSALSTQSFGKMMQVQKVSRQGMEGLRETVETLAMSEGLEAHKDAISIRFEENRQS
jgi:histidinol dehydrogenase